MTIGVLAKKGFIASKIETTPGTAMTLAGADIKSRTFKPTFKPDIDIEERDSLTNTLSSRPSAVGARMGEIAFEAWLAGSTSGNLQSAGCEHHEFLQACGILGTGTSSPDDGMTYTPTSDPANWKFLTIGFWQDAKNYYQIYGAQGNVSFEFRIGKPILAKFAFKGAYSGAPAATSIPTSSIAIPITLNAPVLLAAGCTWASQSSLIIKELDLNIIGVAPEMLTSFNGTDGYAHAHIVDRKPTGRMKLLAPKFTGSSDFEIEKMLRDSTASGLSLTVGSAENNKFVTTIPSNSIQLTGVDHVEENGLRYLDVKFKLVANNTLVGDDEWSILAD